MSLRYSVNISILAMDFFKSMAFYCLYVLCRNAINPITKFQHFKFAMISSVQSIFGSPSIGLVKSSEIGQFGIILNKVIYYEKFFKRFLDGETFAFRYYGL